MDVLIREVGPLLVFVFKGPGTISHVILDTTLLWSRVTKHDVFCIPGPLKIKNKKRAWGRG